MAQKTLLLSDSSQAIQYFISHSKVMQPGNALIEALRAESSGLLTMTDEAKQIVDALREIRKRNGKLANRLHSLCVPNNYPSPRVPIYRQPNKQLQFLINEGFFPRFQYYADMSQQHQEAFDLLYIAEWLHDVYIIFSKLSTQGAVMPFLRFLLGRSNSDDRLTAAAVSIGDFLSLIQVEQESLINRQLIETRIEYENKDVVLPSATLDTIPIISTATQRAIRAAISRHNANTEQMYYESVVLESWLESWTRGKLTDSYGLTCEGLLACPLGWTNLGEMTQPSPEAIFSAALLMRCFSKAESKFDSEITSDDLLYPGLCLFFDGLHYARLLRSIVQHTSFIGSSFEPIHISVRPDADVIWEDNTNQILWQRLNDAVKEYNEVPSAHFKIPAPVSSEWIPL